MQLMRFEETPIEKEEFIEQMRIIENGYNLNSVEVSPSLPSVNEPEDAVIIQNYIKNNPEQQELLKRVMDQLGT